ncbi:hypothetical protein [Microvirga arabica]|uniref:hypothetical protein n=1 Tax=Microvirga arabica TaxID=1128671 RepID=UPI0019395E90|nr:hypothetical protein [Microvirga arabica]MBM1174360.1 hypothetical protein [Microvirga arabica]
MTNVLVFPAGTAAPEAHRRSSTRTPETVFTPDQDARLTFEQGRLYGWSSRDGMLPLAYWSLETDLRALVPPHGVGLAACRLGLPAPFVRGWAVGLGLLASGLRLDLERPPEAAMPEPGATLLSEDGLCWSVVPGAVAAKL